MKKVILFLLTAMLLLVILAGCGSAEDLSKKSNGSANEAKTEQTAEKAAFPLSVKDGTGEELTIEKKPERIVSVLPSNTEIAFALGLGQQIVGVSDHDNYPEEATKKEKIGGLELNVEKILSLNPDLVLADQTNDAKALKQIKEAGIPVLIVGEATDFEGVYSNIELIGKTTGTQKEADKVIKGMKEKLASLKEKASAIKEDKRKDVYIELSPAPEIYTAGKNTFMDTLLSIIHADNASANQNGWSKVNEEAVIAANPDVIITTYGAYVDDPAAEVSSRDGWEDITAVKKNQIFDINADLTNRPGPRLVEGVEELGKAVYPDVFAK
ncbi:ABC transporter substrate-binding protein [Virgibacillus phasianinus]|uniref:ABC transporter substrate-binding protein n=1 Tax=Virgibacillus phasianinus TaxID=2017483 RepID=A0A220U190_9BACI|nr:ABC transporter substrate-binding protein [Virgibacillus phasianinus]ASK61859.1 ABC transporter substrate-binding protein [Virgibacillus phasianinus]